MVSKYVKCRKCGTIIGEWNYFDCEPPRFELCISCFAEADKEEQNKTEPELLEDEWNEMVSVYE